MTRTTDSALARLIERSRAPEEERCELCGVPLPRAHRHVLDLEAGDLQCACRPCALLFDREAAAMGRYRLVPERRVRLAAPPTEVDLDAPVGLSWYVRQPDGSVLVRYPGPAGATTGTASDGTWSALLACWPELAHLTPLVEALLINTARGRREHWIVPIEDCYRLIAVIRTHWRGLSGGTDVWPAVDEFFAVLGAPPGNR